MEQPAAAPFLNVFSNCYAPGMTATGSAYHSSGASLLISSA